MAELQKLPYTAEQDSPDDGTTMNPGSLTLDQILAQEARLGQQSSPVSQQTVEDIPLSNPEVALPPRSAPGKSQPISQAEDMDSDDGSEDWDVMGSEQEDAAAPRASHAILSPSPRAGNAGRSSSRVSSGQGSTLNEDETDSERVPKFETGEPQYKYGDGGGPPVQSSLYLALMSNANQGKGKENDKAISEAAAGVSDLAVRDGTDDMSSRHPVSWGSHGRHQASFPVRSQLPKVPEVTSNGLHNYRDSSMMSQSTPERMDLSSNQSMDAALMLRERDLLAGRRGHDVQHYCQPGIPCHQHPIFPEGMNSAGSDSTVSNSGSERIFVHQTEPVKDWPGAHKASTISAAYADPYNASQAASLRSWTMDQKIGSPKTSETYSSGVDVTAEVRETPSTDSRLAAYPGKKIERWQELPRQASLVQRQIKREMCLMGSMKGDPLGQFQFHIPLFAAVWGVVRESAVVPCLFTRAYKEVLGASVSRGNMCRFCTYWHANTAKELGVVGMRSTWQKRTMSYLKGCPKRFKAVLLWFRDATHVQFFQEPEAIPAPFTVEESAELLAVSFANNMLNRVTLAQLTENETLPMMGLFRPIMQMFPSLHPVMYKSVMKPGSKDPVLPGMSSEVRPPLRHGVSSNFRWAAPLPHISEALAHLDFVVNFHLRVRFLPQDICDQFLLWMDQEYNGIYRGRDHFENWLFYAARNVYPEDPARRDALLYMLMVACSPVKAYQKMHKTLLQRKWHQTQIRAMAPFAAFHAARITVLWQAGSPCVNEGEAANDSLWERKVPDDELW